MELGDVLRRRRMCRNFRDDPVPAEVVDRLLDRARRAPSAGNTQGWSFLVLEGNDQLDAFWDVESDPSWREFPTLPGVLRAPLIVVPLCSVRRYLDRYSEPDKVAAGMTEERAWPAPFWVVDVAFATMILLLSVVDEGLGALFFGLRGAPEDLRARFGVPPEWDAIGAVAIGWPADDRGPVGSAVRGRRPVDEVVHRGRW
ncbi:MAG TPA: nitroreductase family protein [Acidimicrobiales bacterium]|nr:nitroreductase family protein [Acidimicrobiales bacterium]